MDLFAKTVELIMKTIIILGAVYVFGSLFYAIVISPIIHYNPATITETWLSPDGSYQIDVVTYKKGESDPLYQNNLYLERAKANKNFAKVGDRLPRNSKLILGPSTFDDDDYTIEWASDNVLYYKEVPLMNNDFFGVTRIEVTDEEVSLTYGKVSVVKDSSYLNDFVIDGDTVVFNCSVKIENTSDIPCEFRMKASSYSDIGGLLADDNYLLAYDENGQEQIFEIGAGETLTLDVSFYGTKGPLNEKVDRNCPYIMLYYY